MKPKLTEAQAAIVAAIEKKIGASQPPVASDGQGDLTTAYLTGWYKRDDEVSALTRRVRELEQELADKLGNAAVEIAHGKTQNAKLQLLAEAVEQNLSQLTYWQLHPIMDAFYKCKLNKQNEKDKP